MYKSLLDTNNLDLFRTFALAAIDHNCLSHIENIAKLNTNPNRFG